MGRKTNTIDFQYCQIYQVWLSFDPHVCCLPYSMSGLFVVEVRISFNTLCIRNGSIRNTCPFPPLTKLFSIEVTLDCVVYSHSSHDISVTDRLYLTWDYSASAIAVLLCISPPWSFTTRTSPAKHFSATNGSSKRTLRTQGPHATGHSTHSISRACPSGT